MKKRYPITIAFLTIFTIFSLRHFILGGGTATSVDALCPFGGFETLFTFIAIGGFVPRILMSSLILGAGVFLTVVVLRKGFCGYICPFGTIQELLGKITKRKIKIPKKIDHYARYLKYLILATIIIGTAYTETLVFRGYDPFMAFFHFGKGIFWDVSPNEFAEVIVPFAIMIFVLGASIFIERFWCRYLCPLGATMNLFTWISPTNIKRNKKICIDCKICDKRCPMDIKVSTASSIKDPECINCNQCISPCPKDSLSINTFGKKYSTLNYSIFAVALFITVIGISMVAGIWQSVPIIDAEEQILPDQIKGWMSLVEVSAQTGIYLGHLGREFNLPSYIDPNTPIKDIASKYNVDFSVEELREFVDGFTHDEEEGQEIGSNETQCPWNREEDPSPGLCTLYVDKDGNKICDLSE